MFCSGILNIFKNSGVTSYWVVDKIKHIIDIKKVGHCGTLDPLAEGVLVILLGEATKFQEYITGFKKIYKVRLKLGYKTTTGDITGKVIKQDFTKYFKREDVENILSKFIGEIEQVPPMFSALKYKGIPLYKLARRGIEITRQPRKVYIYDIQILDFIDNIITFRIVCSKGTYIRTLGEDIAESLGSVATTEYLVREAVGPFTRDNSIYAPELINMQRSKLLEKVYPIEYLKELTY